MRSAKTQRECCGTRGNIMNSSCVTSTKEHVTLGLSPCSRTSRTAIGHHHVCSVWAKQSLMPPPTLPMVCPLAQDLITCHVICLYVFSLYINKLKMQQLFQLLARATLDRQWMLDINTLRSILFNVLPSRIINMSTSVEF